LVFSNDMSKTSSPWFYPSFFPYIIIIVIPYWLQFWQWFILINIVFPMPLSCSKTIFCYIQKL
jgi:hypothetical protein